MDDSDSRSRSDDSSDPDSDLTAILQYLIRRLVVGELRYIPRRVLIDLLKFEVQQYRNFWNPVRYESVIR
jgi:hypothetical protein